MTYEEVVINAAISYYVTRPASDPEQAIGIGETIADALVEAKYLEPDAPPQTNSDSQ